MTRRGWLTLRGRKESFVPPGVTREPGTNAERTMAVATRKNQERIIANEQRILRNQRRLLRILDNEKRILQTLQAVLKNQKKILGNQSKILAK